MVVNFRPAKSGSPVALITGGSEGIGRACVRCFLEEGWRVSTISLDGAKSIPSTSRLLCSSGDLALEPVRRELVRRTLDRYGRIDLLVNNAGVGLYAPPSTTDLDLLRRMFEVNFVAVLRLAQLVIPGMRAQGGGTIVNIGSVGGDVALPWTAGYSASKFAVHAITDSLRREVASAGIRVIKICPGIVDTDFRRNVLHGVPPSGVLSLRRVVSPDAVAKAVLRGITSDRDTIYVPRIGRVFAAIQHLAPWVMDWYLGRLYGSLHAHLESPFPETQTEPFLPPVSLRSGEQA